MSAIGSPPDRDEKKRRVILDLPESVIEQLDALSKLQGSTRSTAIVNAILSDAYLLDKVKHGYKLFMEDQDGRKYRLKKD